MSERYCLIYDGDGHAWLCPVERRAEALAQIGAVCEFWSSARPGHPPEGDEPVSPEDLDWLIAVDNVHRLTFSEPQEDL